MCECGGCVYIPATRDCEGEELSMRSKRLALDQLVTVILALLRQH